MLRYMKKLKVMKFSDLEDDIGKMISDTEFAWEEILENELDSDVGQLNLLMSEANYHVVKNLLKKKLEEDSSKVDKEINRKSKEKVKGKEKSKGKVKDKGKRKGKYKKIETKPGEIDFD